jgi:hypothetical protein
MTAPRNLGWAVLGLSLYALVAAGCFHKDVMTDTADDVVSNLLYQGPEGNLIISKEEIFQANSKSSGGGVTHISGYAEYRLSSYRVATGELAGRVELGEGIEEANALLGYSEGKIWMFSIDPELGLHYRDPQTLEVKEAWGELSQKPGLNAFKPARPEWPLIDQYFVYDWERDRVLLTDEAGFKYALDPNTFKFEKLEVDFPRVDWDEDILNGSGALKKDDNIYLEGDPRKVISYLGKKSSGDLSFLFGEWLVDPSPKKAAERKNAERQRITQAIRANQDSITAYEALHPEIKVPQKQFSWEDQDKRSHCDQFKRNIDDLKRELDRLNSAFNHVFDYPMVTNDGRSGYVFHANVVSDTAHVIISRVNLGADSTWSLAWSTDLVGIYHNTSTADQAGAFETVYSKGNPEFDYRWVTTDGNYLVLISQLHMLALDLKSGKLAWNIEI